MAKRFNSFLLRHWRLDDASDRLEVEHIQSGRQLHATSLASVFAWIGGGGAGTPSIEQTETAVIPPVAGTPARGDDQV